MSVHSKNKGAAGERELALLFREHGFSARRGQQFAGGGDSPDVVHDAPLIHVECKRTETLQLWPAIEQARRDAAPGKIPVVFHRPSRREWIAILDGRHLLQILASKKVDEVPQ